MWGDDKGPQGLRRERIQHRGSGRAPQLAGHHSYTLKELLVDREGPVAARGDMLRSGPAPALGFCWARGWGGAVHHPQPTAASPLGARPSPWAPSARSQPVGMSIKVCQGHLLC